MEQNISTDGLSHRQSGKKKESKQKQKHTTYNKCNAGFGMIKSNMISW